MHSHMCIGLIHNMASVLAGLPPAMQVKVSHKLLSLTTFTSYLDIMRMWPHCNWTWAIPVGNNRTSAMWLRMSLSEESINSNDYITATTTTCRPLPISWVRSVQVPLQLDIDLVPYHQINTVRNQTSSVLKTRWSETKFTEISKWQK